MINKPATSMSGLPYKSAAVALLFSVLLGPLGLLYASFWGGVTMLVIGLIVISSKLLFAIAVFWITCCVWAVAAVESYNKKIMTE